MMVAAMSFRKLNSPQSAEKVARGTKYDSGKEIRVAAKSFYPPIGNGSK